MDMIAKVISRLFIGAIMLVVGLAIMASLAAVIIAYPLFVIVIIFFVMAYNVGKAVL